MGLSFLTPLFLAGILGIAVPIVIHLIRRHRGRVVRFPSLMFLRQLPVQSVQRRTIRDWPLLLLRIGALALIALAFARPVLQLGASEDGALGDALREVVLVVDRSWSMEQGDRWDDAIDGARAELGGLVTPDRVSLVVFDGVGNVIVEPTLDPSRVQAALDTLQPGWGGTQIGAGLQAAGGILQSSDRTRREIVLLSDFQRRGWDDGPRDPLPEGTLLSAVDVGDDGLGAMMISDVTLEHFFAEGRQRVRPIARVVRQGEQAPTTATISLEFGGQEAGSQTVNLPTGGATTVAFDPITLPEEAVGGAVSLAGAGSEPGVPFRFVVSPNEILSVLLVEPTGESGFFLRNALSVPGGQPMSVERTTAGTLSSTALQGVDLVVFNDVPLPSGASGSAVREHVRTGGGILIATGPESAPDQWETSWNDILPARPGDFVDRNPARGASLAQVERDHPIFTVFQGVSGSGLGTPRFFRYRELDVPTPTPTEPGGDVDLDAEPRVLARFDDGAPALAQRIVGAGRVLVWTSSFDVSWGDMPLNPVFVPFIREAVQFAAGTTDRVPYFTVGQPVDARFLLVEAGMMSPADDAAAASEAPIGMLVGPEGVATELRGGGELVELTTPGFYEVRDAPDGTQARWVMAVNPDVREADPARIDPEELILAAAPGSVGTDGPVDVSEGGDLAAEDATRRTQLEEGERRQSAWRFLLLGAMLLLIAETVLAGRRKPLAQRA